MVGTYKYDGKEVSEREFKEKVYGSDSAQVKNYDKAQARKKSSSSSKSKYSSGKDKLGNPVYWDEKGQRYEGTAPDAQTQSSTSEKKTIVIGVGKDETGKTKVENVGKYLTEEQRKQVSKLASEKGRLTTQQVKETQTQNAQGETVVSRSVQFSYKDQTQKTVSKSNFQPPAYLMKEAQDRFRENPNAQKVTLKSQEGEWTFTRTGKTEEKETPEYIGSGGILTVGEKPKGLYNKLSDKRERLLDQIDKNTYKQEASFKEGASLFAVGLARGVVGLGSAVIHPVRTVKGLFTAVTNPMSTIKNLGTEFTRDPSGFIGEFVGGAGVIKAVGVGGKLALNKYKAPKVVGETGGQSVRVDLSDDLAKTTSKSSTSIKSGSQNYKVEAVTKAVDKADDSGARLQSAKTDLKIQTIDKKGGVKQTNTGFSKSEVVVSKADDGTLLARGDTVQATNVKGGSVTRQGYFTSVGQSFDDGSRATTIVKTGKGVKGQLVDKADDLQFVDDASKKVTGVESSASKKVLEFEAPQKTTYDTPVGKIEVTSKQSFKNTVYDDVASARGGSYLTKAEKSLNIKVDPYSQTTSQGGVSVSFKGFADDAFGASPVKSQVSPDAKALTSLGDGNSLSLTLSDQGYVLSAKKIISTKNPTPSFSSSQALTAVEDVVSQSIKKQSVIIDQGVKTATGAKVVTMSSNELTKLKPVQYITVKGSTPVSVSKSETQNKAITRTKNFSSSKVLAKQKTAVESVIDVKTRSKSKVALATATSQVSDVAQSTQQKTSVVQLTAQKVSSNQVVKPVVVNPLIGVLPVPKSSPVKQTPISGFAVYVREKGIFKRVGKKSFSEKEARDLGAFTVANTARATFTLRPSYSPLGQVSSKVRGSFSAFRSNFLQKNGLFIEKKEKRIKTGGEKAGITRKGILANKNKGLFKGLKL